MKEAKQEQLASTRRNQILDAAARVFADKGFHGTTIKDIAKAAGIADGTVYIYFPNKPALLVGILDRMREAVQQEASLPPLAGMSLHTFIRTYLQHPLNVFEADNFELFRVIISEIMINQDMRERYQQQVLGPMMTRAEQYFQHWAAQNNVALGDTALLMHTLSSMVMGLIVQRIMGDETLEAQWDTLPNYMSDLLVHGIRRN